MKTLAPYDFAVSVIRKLTENGFRAVMAGGCVRDKLRGATPKDYDVATSARPEQVMALFNRNVPVGVAFGVVCVLGPGENPIQIEVATFRGDSTYSDGRHPDSVTFTGEVEDARRRDFTINGLFYDPLKDEVLDYVGGQEDLQRKVIRCIGDPKLRFGEDRLRMLRAVRFASTLDFEIDGHTLGAIKDSAAHITDISAERIREELSSMLSGPNPRRAFELLKKTRLLKHILPEIDAMEGVAQPPQFHPEGDVWTHTLMLLGQLENVPLTLALGVLFHDVGKPPTFVKADRIRFNEHEKVGAEMTRSIMTRLKFSNEEIERVVSLVAQHMVFKDAEKMRPSKLKRFIRQPHFDEHLALHRADCMASHGDLSAYEFCSSKLKEASENELNPEPLITGSDLIGLGLTPGPEFKVILRQVEDLQLEGSLKSRDDALAFVKSNFVSR
jgi:poly(A) polymerase